MIQTIASLNQFSIVPAHSVNLGGGTIQVESEKEIEPQNCEILYQKDTKTGEVLYTKKDFSIQVFEDNLLSKTNL